MLLQLRRMQQAAPHSCILYNRFSLLKLSLGFPNPENDKATTSSLKLSEMEVCLTKWVVANPAEFPDLVQYYC